MTNERTKGRRNRPSPAWRRNQSGSCCLVPFLSSGAVQDDNLVRVAGPCRTTALPATAFCFSALPKVLPKMATEKSQPEKQRTAVSTNPVTTSCRKKKSDDATFLEDIKDHIDEFIHASMDEHKTCFKKTIQKMFGMSKIVAERSSNSEGVESSLPLQTTVSE